MFGYRLSCLWRNISSLLTPKFGLTKRFLALIFFFCDTFLTLKDVFACSVFLDNIILVSFPVLLSFFLLTLFKARNCSWMQVQHQIHKASQGFSLPVCWDKGIEGTQVSSHSPYVMDPMPWVNRATSGRVVRQGSLGQKNCCCNQTQVKNNGGLTGGGGAASHPFFWLESKQSVCPADSAS